MPLQPLPTDLVPVSTIPTDLVPVAPAPPTVPNDLVPASSSQMFANSPFVGAGDANKLFSWQSAPQPTPMGTNAAREDDVTPQPTQTSLEGVENVPENAKGHLIHAAGSFLDMMNIYANPSLSKFAQGIKDTGRRTIEQNPVTNPVGQIASAAWNLASLYGAAEAAPALMGGIGAGEEHSKIMEAVAAKGGTPEQARRAANFGAPLAGAAGYASAFLYPGVPATGSVIANKAIGGAAGSLLQGITGKAVDQAATGQSQSAADIAKDAATSAAVNTAFGAFEHMMGTPKATWQIPDEYKPTFVKMQQIRQGVADGTIDPGVGNQAMQAAVAGGTGDTGFVSKTRTGETVINPTGGVVLTPRDGAVIRSLFTDEKAPPLDSAVPATPQSVQSKVTPAEPVPTDLQPVDPQLIQKGGVQREIQEGQAQGQEEVLSPAQSLDKSTDAGANTPAPLSQPQPGFSRAALERTLIDRFDPSGNESAISAGSELDKVPYANVWRGTGTKDLPEEMQHAIQANPDLVRAINFTPDGPTGGPDALHEFGDRYFDLLGQLGATKTGKLDAAMQSARQSEDPETQFLAAYHNTLPDRVPQVMIDPSRDLQTGDQVQINKRDFEVTEDEDGYKSLKDGDEFPVTPLDALGKIPIDKGFDIQKSPEPAIPDDLVPVQHSGISTGLFGQGVIDSSGIGAQQPMFHQPLDTPSMSSNPQDAAIAKKFDPKATPALFRQGAVNIGAMGDAARGIVGASSNLARSAGDAMSLKVLPKASRLGIADEMVAHAGAHIAVQPMVNDLLAKTFPDQYHDPEAMSKTMAVIVKDNILQGRKDFLERALVAAQKAQPGVIKTHADMASRAQQLYQEARAGNADAVQWRKTMASAHNIAAEHDLNQYHQDVQAGVADPVIKANIEQWKQHVQPFLDQLYNEIKAVDPQIPREGRGFYTKARVNLMQLEGDESPEVTNKSPGGSTRNPNVKRDRFDRMARFTGNYSTDAEAILSNVLGPRWNEVTKLRVYNAMLHKGVAVMPESGRPLPKMIDGQKAIPQGVKIPQTDPQTGLTHMVERTMAVRADVYRELRAVLNTDLQLVSHPIAQAMTAIQLLSPVDLIAHAKNMLAVAANAPGTKSAWTDILRKLPMLKQADAITRLVSTAMVVASDSPSIRGEMARLAKQGLIRPNYPATGIQKITHGQQMLHAVDTAARVLMNRFFDNLVERGDVTDSIVNRRNFVNQMGNYNARLMGDFTRAARNSGLSPFIVAGRTMNTNMRRMLTGNPGVEGADASKSAKLRAIQIAGLALTFAIPAILNYLRTKKFGGRPGVPLGAWDTGLSDARGNPRYVDLAQLEGLRRGMRTVGASSAVEGAREGKTKNTIAGDAMTEAMQAALHPWLGPALGFTAAAITGSRLDLRGKMEAQHIPEGGILQKLENARAALQAQNPLLYAVLQPLLKKAGIDQTTGGGMLRGMASGPGSAIASAIGLSTATGPKTAAMALAQQFAAEQYGGTSLTPVQQAKADVKRQIEDAMIKDRVTGIAMMVDAVQAGKITKFEGSQLMRDARDTALQYRVKHEEADQALQVWAVSTDAEKAEIRVEVMKKIMGSKTINPEQKASLIAPVREWRKAG